MTRRPRRAVLWILGNKWLALAQVFVVLSLLVAWLTVSSRTATRDDELQTQIMQNRHRISDGDARIRQLEDALVDAGQPVPTIPPTVVAPTTTQRRRTTTTARRVTRPRPTTTRPAATTPSRTTTTRCSSGVVVQGQCITAP